MIQGPSVGPAMLLNVLMRWPQMIIVCGLAGGGYLVSQQVDAPQYIDSVRKLAIEYGVMKSTEVVEAAKKVEVIPAAVAAPAPNTIVHDHVAVTVDPIITEARLEELKRLQRIQLESPQVTPVRLGQ